jgi:hypothetical protein
MPTTNYQSTRHHIPEDQYLPEFCLKGIAVHVQMLGFGAHRVKRFMVPVFYTGITLKDVSGQVEVTQPNEYKMWQAAQSACRRAVPPHRCQHLSQQLCLKYRLYI